MHDQSCPNNDDIVFSYQTVKSLDFGADDTASKWHIDITQPAVTTHEITFRGSRSKNHDDHNHHVDHDGHNDLNDHDGSNEQDDHDHHSDLDD